MARPVCKRVLAVLIWPVCFNVSGLGVKPRPRWRYARPGPHKIPGVERRFLNQASRTPFDCQAISLPPPANICGRRRLRGAGRSDRYAVAQRRGVEILAAAQHRPRDPRQLVGQCDGGCILMDARYEFAQPAPNPVFVVSCPRFSWTPICPTGGRYGEVQHEQDHAK